jgi:hypothetical protein
LGYFDCSDIDGIADKRRPTYNYESGHKEEEEEFWLFCNHLEEKKDYFVLFFLFLFCGVLKIV